MADDSETVDELVRRFRESNEFVRELSVRAAEIESGHPLDVEEGERPTFLQYNSAHREADRTRSFNLLRQWLSPQQLEDWEKTQSFKVKGCHSGTTYQLINTSVYNIKPLDNPDMHSAKAYCVVPKGNLPLGDQLLAQKIWLETDEFATLMKANRQ